MSGDWTKWEYDFADGILQVKTRRWDLHIPVPSGPWRTRKRPRPNQQQQSAYMHLVRWDPRQLRFDAKAEHGREVQMTVLSLRYGWSPPEGISILVPKPPKKIRNGSPDAVIASVLKEAAAAGKWDIVSRLAEELAARRTQRGLFEK